MNEARQLDAVEIGPPDAAASVVWLHGLGADGWDFYPIARELDLPRELRLRFVFPHAPQRPVTINGGMVMRAWYDISALDLDARGQDEAGIRESDAIVRAFLDREMARGVLPERIVLAGFSQGAAMTIFSALRAPMRLAGAIALSSYLLLPGTTSSEASAANAGLSFFMGHGTGDPIVPYPAGEVARDLLLAADHPVEWHSYPIPHGVSPAEIADVGRWLAAKLG